ncbi:MAG: hypothetical protein SNJ58_04800 [Aggregatilineales bacterium]
MRKFIYLVAILAAIAGSFAALPDASAQGAPSEAALDRVFADISVRIGRTVSRARFDGVWTYEQIVVSDDNLGCPNGQRSAPGQTRAWIVRVTVNSFGSYEYRISNDSTLVFFCTGVGVGASLPPTAAAPAEPVSGRLPIPPPIGIVESPATLPAPVMAFIGYDGNVYVTSIGSAAGYAPLTGDAAGVIAEDGSRVTQRGYTSLRWSPDGSRLAFLETSSQTLFVVASGGRPVPIASNVSPQFPPAWSPDGNFIAYVTTDSRPAADPSDYIYTVGLVPAMGGPAGVVGQIQLRAICGGGGFGPSLLNYLSETSIGRSPILFRWVPNGFLHSMSCDGTGLALTGLDGTRYWALPNLFSVQLWYDGTRAVALERSLDFRRGNTLVLVDTQTALVTPIGGAIAGEQVGWGGDGSTIFVARRELIQKVSVMSSAPFAPSFFALDGDSYRLRLFAVPLTGGEAQLVYESEGYAIANITSTPINALTAFSIIESEIALIGRLNANDTYQNVLSAAPRIKIGIMRLPLGTPGYPYVIGADGSGAVFSSAPLFAAVPTRVITAVMPPVGLPTVPPVIVPTVPGPAGPTAVPALRATDGENPLGLVVGGRAVVTPGDPVIVRNTPQYLRDRSNAIGILRPNEVVRVLVGPIFADNLRWWQVQREIGGLTGWVVDQYIDANGRVETNIQPLR